MADFNLVDAAYSEEDMDTRSEELKETEYADNVKEIKKATRKPYAIWEVGGKTYRLVLRTQDIQELERRYKKNLMNIMGEGNEGMPPLTVMLDVTRVAMARQHHGMGRSEIAALFDEYVQEGGSQLDFYMTVYMDIFLVSGFFSANATERMAEGMKDATQMM